MQSVFKAPLGAAVLAEVDAGRLKLDDPIILTEQELSPPRAPSPTPIRAAATTPCANFWSPPSASRTTPPPTC
uniref:Serine hydrolase n=1 Tax=Phenylobacterium glaciei TaxID=2803784 RepID=A0A974P579_9CAUL|nr:serine hydrolase [Phenylobacterium glaciei]